MKTLYVSDLDGTLLRSDEVTSEYTNNVINLYPIVYAYIEGKEKFSFVPKLCTAGMKKFINSRTGDIRMNVVNTADDLKAGDIFYITCIDRPEKLKPLYDKYKDTFHCVYQTDIYTKEQWLEGMEEELF